MARPPKPEVKVSGDAKELFSQDELVALQDEAKKEFDEELKLSAREAFKEETKNKLRKAQIFKPGVGAVGDDVEHVQINLAPHSNQITLDGRLYYHGLTYPFTQAQAQTIKDVMARTWQHEREIGGANINAEHGRRPLGQTISPTQGI